MGSTRGIETGVCMFAYNNEEPKKNAITGSRTSPKSF